jgi:hypothetical protein
MGSMSALLEIDINFNDASVYNKEFTINHWVLYETCIERKNGSATIRLYPS